MIFIVFGELYIGYLPNYRERAGNSDRSIYCATIDNSIVLMGIKFPIAVDYINVLGEKTYGADQIFK